MNNLVSGNFAFIFKVYNKTPPIQLDRDEFTTVISGLLIHAFSAAIPRSTMFQVFARLLSDRKTTRYCPDSPQLWIPGYGDLQ